jgi:hypothetical protein
MDEPGRVFEGVFLPLQIVKKPLPCQPINVPPELIV